MDIQLLDCTLRDGGLGLEDLAKTESSECGFKEDSLLKVLDYYLSSNIDIIEIGSIEITENDMTKFSIYQDIEGISKIIPKNRVPNQKYAALFRGPDTDIEDIPEWNENLCEVVRVIIRYSQLKKSMDFCADLANKGYKVCVQPMLTMRYSNEELDYIINVCNQIKAYALYFVDSYGYMQKKDIERFFYYYNSRLDNNIRIGFHAHNNMNLALSNVLDFIEIAKDRKIIIDSCAVGMGQGAGNLQTELIIPIINKKLDNIYNYDCVLDICEEIEKYTQVPKWGYSVTRAISAINNTAYKYSVALRNQYKLSFREINNILSCIPEELKQRYTPHNTKILLKLNGYNFEE